VDDWAGIEFEPTTLSGDFDSTKPIAVTISARATPRVTLTVRTDHISRPQSRGGWKDVMKGFA
jgi:hypothetical protein